MVLGALVASCSRGDDPKGSGSEFLVFSVSPTTVSVPVGETFELTFSVATDRTFVQIVDLGGASPPLPLRDFRQLSGPGSSFTRNPILGGIDWSRPSGDPTPDELVATFECIPAGTHVVAPSVVARSGEWKPFELVTVTCTESDGGTDAGGAGGQGGSGGQAGSGGQGGTDGGGGTDASQDAGTDSGQGGADSGGNDAGSDASSDAGNGCAAEVEPNDTPAAAQDLGTIAAKSGACVNIVCDVNTKELFKFTTSQSLPIALGIQACSGGINDHVLIELLDSSGSLVASLGSGTCPVFGGNIPSLPAGTYFLSIGCPTTGIGGQTITGQAAVASP